MIFVLEIPKSEKFYGINPARPHEVGDGSPTCWCASNKKEFVFHVNWILMKIVKKLDEIDEKEFDLAVASLKNDMTAVHVFMNEDEVLAALADEAMWGCYAGQEAREKLRRELDTHGYGREPEPSYVDKQGHAFFG